MAMEETPVWKLLIRLSAPVMLALLIQSIYNIVDSYFVARYSAEGLAALSIIFPIQLLMTALATGTGAGINILISRMDGAGDTKSQKDIISTGFFLGIMGALIFAAAGAPGIRIYYQISSGNMAYNMPRLFLHCLWGCLWRQQAQKCCRRKVIWFCPCVLR